MTEFTPPETQELEAVLGPALARAGRVRGAIRVVARAPLAYASTSPIEVVTCVTDSGVIPILCKYPGPARRTEHGSRRGTAGEAVVYRDVLPLLGVTTPTYYGAHVEATTGDTWLFLEFLPECERLNLAAAPGVVRAAARWLGTFHARGERYLHAGGALSLEAWSRDSYLGWAKRTQRFTASLRHEYPWLEPACARFEQVAEVLAKAPRTVVHGEFYPKNILLDSGRVVPVDWESALIGPGEIDLASLIENWESEDVDACVAAYSAARWPEGPPSTFPDLLLAGKYYWSVRWLGTNRTWSVAEKLRPRILELRDHLESWDGLPRG